MTPPPQRVILMIQGPPSPLWREVGATLEAQGARVVKVDLCLADSLFWRRPGARRYRGRLSEFRPWLAALAAREGVTDFLYYADRLPYHRIAQKLARAHGLGAWALEFGYLRPDWLTLERYGNSAYSHFPHHPADLDPDAPPIDVKIRYGHSFAVEALGEVSFNLLASAGRPFFPFYAPDKYVPPILDYLAWLPKLARTPLRNRRADALQRSFLAEGAPRFFMTTLQMQSDFALRHSGRHPLQKDMIAEIIGSFARAAPADARLLFKTHPLDNGWTNWARIARRAARAHGVAQRVACIDGGDFGALTQAACGMLCATSTTGLHGLQAALPVKALGGAVYDMAGLTHQGPLDAFWREARPPEPGLLDRFIRNLAAETQIKGSAYHPEGRRIAAVEIARRIIAAPPHPALDAPPRLGPLIAARRALRKRR